MNFVIVSVALINAIAALLTGYVAWRELQIRESKNGGNNGHHKPKSAPKARSIRSPIRPRSIGRGDLPSDKGKQRFVVGTYRESFQLSVMSAW